MLYFDSDYMEGAHPAILQRLMETNMEHTYGYGKDAYCESAKAKIRTACQCPEAEIYFLVGGTQTNATVIRGFLKPFEGVIAADTGHIGVHEAGAIESGGHKVLTIPHKNGKLEAAAVKHYLERFYQDGSCTHMVQPGMIYISHPTEYGTLYTKEELKALRRVRGWATSFWPISVKSMPLFMCCGVLKTTILRMLKAALILFGMQRLLKPN